MKLTTKDVSSALRIYQALIQADRENKFIFPSAVRIRTAGNLRRLKPIGDEISEAHDTLVKKYGTKHPKNPNSWEVLPENPQYDAFKAEQKEALAEEHEVEIRPLTNADIGENQLGFDLIAEMELLGLKTIEEEEKPSAKKEAK